MNKKEWLIPILIVAINALAIIVRWSSLPELLPAHFDLDGNAGGSMSRNMLLLHPLIGAAICLGAYQIAHVKPQFHRSLIVLSSGFGLIMLSSSMVTLTSGTMPVFMLAEPVILLVTVVAAVICVLKSRKNKS